MDQVKTIFEHTDIVYKFRPWWDVLSDYSTYVVIFIGTFLTVLYVSLGGELVYCFPVLDCVNITQETSRRILTECRKYNTSSGSVPLHIIKNLANLYQYKYINRHCAQEIIGPAYHIIPFLFLVSVTLLGTSRVWYNLPMVKPLMQGLDNLMEEAAKLPLKDKLEELLSDYENIEARGVKDPSKKKPFASSFQEPEKNPGNRETIDRKDNSAESIDNQEEKTAFKMEDIKAREGEGDATEGTPLLTSSSQDPPKDPVDRDPKDNSNFKKRKSMEGKSSNYKEEDIEANGANKQAEKPAYKVEEASGVEEAIVPRHSIPNSSQGPEIIDRKSYFKTREGMARKSSNFKKEDIQQILTFNDSVIKWTKIKDDSCRRIYSLLALLRIVIGVASVILNGFVIDKWLSQHVPCHVPFTFDIPCNRIECMFTGKCILTVACFVAEFFLFANIMFTLVAFVQVMAEFGCKVFSLCGPFEFLMFLLKVHNKLEADQVDLFNKELKKDQMLADSICNFKSLGIDREGKFPKYTLKEDVSAMPSCLFSDKIDSQEWCFVIENQLELTKEFLGSMKMLEMCRELIIRNCYSVSCPATFKNLETLRVESCVLPSNLAVYVESVDEQINRIDTRILTNFAQIGHSSPPHNQENVKNDTWRIEGLKYLYLSNVRPSTFLLLRADDLTKLVLSRIDITSLKDVVSKLTGIQILIVKDCTLVEKAVKIESGSCKELTISSCGLEEFPILNCQALEKLDLSKNRLAQGPEEGFHAPKLKELTLTRNMFCFLTYQGCNVLFSGMFPDMFCFPIYHGCNLARQLQSFDISYNQIIPDRILSDISLLYYFGSKDFSHRLLHETHYGSHNIEAIESQFPRFDRRKGVKKIAIFYCDIRDNRTRRRVMVYMSCVAQYLYRDYGWNVSYHEHLDSDMLENVNDFCLFMALQSVIVSDNVSVFKEFFEDKNKKENALVVWDIEFTRDNKIATEVKEHFNGYKTCGSVMKQYPLTRDSSTLHLIARNLKIGKSIEDTRNDIASKFKKKTEATDPKTTDNFCCLEGKIH